MISEVGSIIQAVGPLTAHARAVYAALLPLVPLLKKFPLFGQYVSFVVVGIVFFQLSARKRGEKISLKDSVRKLFPADIYRHPSQIVEYWALPVTLFSTFLIFSALTLTAEPVRAWLLRVFGESPVAIQDGWGAVALQSAVIFMVPDFGYYLQHYLFHKVPALWCFHRVHHSAEVLTPFTGQIRAHPMEIFISFLFTGPGSGIVIGILLYLGGMKLSLTAVSVAATLSMAAMVMHPFRHSHIWISYGKTASRVFSSPCMHHIHHSTSPEHWNKNYALVLSLWDNLFGTIYIPEKRETFSFGIRFEELGAGNPHLSIRQYLLEPFVPATRMLLGLAGPGERDLQTAPAPSAQDTEVSA